MLSNTSHCLAPISYCMISSHLHAFYVASILYGLLVRMLGCTDWFIMEEYPHYNLYSLHAVSQINGLSNSKPVTFGYSIVLHCYSHAPLLVGSESTSSSGKWRRTAVAHRLKLKAVVQQSYHHRRCCSSAIVIYAYTSKLALVA